MSSPEWNNGSRWGGLRTYFLWNYVEWELLRFIGGRMMINGKDIVTILEN